MSSVVFVRARPEVTIVFERVESGKWKKVGGYHCK